MLSTDQSINAFVPYCLFLFYKLLLLEVMLVSHEMSKMTDGWDCFDFEHTTINWDTPHSAVLDLWHWDFSTHTWVQRFCLQNHLQLFDNLAFILYARYLSFIFQTQVPRSMIIQIDICILFLVSLITSSILSHYIKSCLRSCHT